ncbi:uncharacterized protein LOC120328304 isoform X1 [Styela clava]
MSGKTKHRRRDIPVETRNLPPVQDAVREYRVIEDGAYAYHLQNEEIENHYSQNVNMRRTVMEDIKRAKELQDEEDRIARIMTLDEEKEVKQMDEELAEIIQEEIFKESIQEKQERKEREERDQELALLMEEKERRRVDNSKVHEERDKKLAERLQNMKMTPTPPGSRDQQRMRLMTDEELAKRLQEEEDLKLKRTKERSKELKSVVELQDEELAKYIHGKEIEAAEMKFGKERQKRKSKTKGKWDNEPLYYDDNVNPPVYQEFPPKERSEKSHRPHANGDHPPHYSRSENNRTSGDQHSRQHDHHRVGKRPERPPPPKFSDSHNTEIKIPLDDSQRRHRERIERETHSRSSRDHDKHSSSHDRNRTSNSKHGSKGSQDSLDKDRSYNDRHRHDRERYNGNSSSNHRSEERRHHQSSSSHDDRRYHSSSSNDDLRRSDNHPDSRRQRSSPRDQETKPVPRPRGHMTHSQSMPDPDREDEIQYSESFAKLTEEESWNQNNNLSQHKGSRKKKGKEKDCKQQ